MAFQEFPAEPRLLGEQRPVGPGAPRRPHGLERLAALAGPARHLQPAQHREDEGRWR